VDVSWIHVAQNMGRSCEESSGFLREDLGESVKSNKISVKGVIKCVNEHGVKEDKQEEKAQKL
jgi:hypothetical protein